MDPDRRRLALARPLLPWPDTAPASDAPGLRPHQPEQGRSNPRKRPRQRHTDEEWEKIRPLVTQLYMLHTLEETIENVKRTTGFEAGIRRFRDKISEWDLSKKHIKAEELQIILAKREKRRREDGRDTVILKDGIKVDDPRLQTFQRRQPTMTGWHASPSAATPEGMEYYTPRSRPDSTQESPAHTPLENEEQGPSSRAPAIFFSKYSEDSSLKNLIYLRSITHHNYFKPFSPFHPFHRTGSVGAAGSGRFRDDSKLLQCFWGAIQVAKVLQSFRLDSPSTSSPLSLRSIERQPHPRPPRYSFHVSSSEDGPVWNKDAILGLVQQERFFQNLLGLTRDDCARWLSQWSLMNANESAQWNKGALTMFGDSSLPYPDTHLIRLIVHFQTSNSVAGDMLLQIVIGYDSGEYVRECDNCSSESVMVDLVGPDGATKVHLTVPNEHDLRCWQTLEDLKSNTKIRSSQTVAKWKELSYKFQGLLRTPVFKRCPCGQKYHHTDKGGHLLDLSQENGVQDVWDNEASAEQDSRFETFPLEGIQYHIMGPPSDSSDSEEEKWDPEGLRSGEDEFEPGPEQGEEHSYDALRYSEY